MAARQAEGAELPTDRVSLGHLLARVGHRMSQRVELTLGRAGLNVEQWRVLDLLSDNGGHPMTEIAAHALVPAPTLTKIVDRLVDATLVYRRPDEVDRRRVLVFLSDHGRQLHAELGPQVSAAEGEIVEDLDHAGRAQLMQLLHLLV